MKLDFKLNASLDVPIYQQLVDMIKSAVKKGDLPAGEKLPTVKEMTESLSIARGTVKRAYDELEREGIIEKSQGRGTFVCFLPSRHGGRKEQAMEAIDAMLSQLEDMGFSAQEINIFLNLKLRERSEEESLVKIAVVECNPENLSYISEQLRHVSGVDLYTFMLDTIQQYPYKLAEDFDLVVSTSSHAQYLEQILPPDKRLVRMALCPSQSFLSKVIRLPSGKRLGVIGASGRFSQLMYRACRDFCEDVELMTPLTSEDSGIEEYLSSLDCVVVPKLYDRHLSPHARELLSAFKGEIIECYYEMDAGSLLYLETKVKRLLSEKRL